MPTKNGSYICIRKENRYINMIKKRSKTPTCHVHVYLDLKQRVQMFLDKGFFLPVVVDFVRVCGLISVIHFLLFKVDWVIIWSCLYITNLSALESSQPSKCAFSSVYASSTMWELWATKSGGNQRVQERTCQIPSLSSVKWQSRV